LSVFVIPASLELLGSSCFSGCSALSEVTFPTRCPLKKICHATFSGCLALTSLTIPENVIAIEGGAFMKSGITQILIHSNKFSSDSFMLASLIEDSSRTVLTRCLSRDSDIQIPSSVITIDQYAFAHCTWITRIRVQEDSAFHDIRSYAFDHCSNLAEVELSTTVTILEENCFANCSELVSISIPSPSQICHIGNRHSLTVPP
jgi:hypothetical protein